MQVRSQLTVPTPQRFDVLRRGSRICGQLMGGHAAVESGRLGFGLGRVGHPLDLCHFDFVLLVGLVNLVVAGTHAPVHVIIEVFMAG